MGGSIDDLLEEYIHDIEELERSSRNRRLNAPTEPPPPTHSGVQFGRKALPALPALDELSIARRKKG